MHNAACLGNSDGILRALRPIVHAELGNLMEAGQIPGEKQRSMRQGDRRDFKIHRPDARAQTLDSLEYGHGVTVKIEYGTSGKIIKQGVQSGVAFDLLVRGFGSCDEGEPAAHLFFETDDRNCNLIVSKVKTLHQTAVLLAIRALNDA